MELAPAALPSETALTEPPSQRWAVLAPNAPVPRFTVWATLTQAFTVRPEPMAAQEQRAQRDGAHARLEIADDVVRDERHPERVVGPDDDGRAEGVAPLEDGVGIGGGGAGGLLPVERGSETCGRTGDTLDVDEVDLDGGVAFDRRGPRPAGDGAGDGIDLPGEVREEPHLSRGRCHRHPQRVTSPLGAGRPAR